jgi:outer membrane murein-binding lipoprotein Lpp
MKPFAIFHFTFAIILLAGCSSPNKANINLRKQNAELRTQLENLQREHEADVAAIRAAESRGGTTVPALPSERLAELFTVHGIQFGKLTGIDPDRANALKAYVVPTDGVGEPIKAAGSFVVEAFDLAAGADVRLGRWEFPVRDAAKNWFGKGLLYTYVLPLPLEKTPGHGEITLRVMFTDGLTGREFSEQRIVKISK